MPRAKTPRVPPDLVDWLRENFPPRCIGANELPLHAHRYAAQAELAQRLIRFGTSDESHEAEIETD